MKKKHWLLGEVARLLGVKCYRINYAISSGLVEEPALRISNKRIFQPLDVQRLANHFKVKQGENDGESDDR
jgi:DNA-binding transcriptional MerR regulator